MVSKSERPRSRGSIEVHVCKKKRGIDFALMIENELCVQDVQFQISKTRQLELRAVNGNWCRHVSR